MRIAWLLAPVAMGAGLLTACDSGDGNSSFPDACTNAYSAANNLIDENETAVDNLVEEFNHGVDILNAANTNDEAAALAAANEFQVHVDQEAQLASAAIAAGDKCQKRVFECTSALGDQKVPKSCIAGLQQVTTIIDLYAQQLANLQTGTRAEVDQLAAKVRDDAAAEAAARATATSSTETHASLDDQVSAAIDTYNQDAKTCDKALD